MCQECLEKTKLLTTINCLYCQKAALEGYTHSHCGGRYKAERVLSIVPFTYPWREVLHTLKYRKHGPGTVSLIEELLYFWRAETGVSIPGNFFIVPTPLHWQKRFNRQFNQAEEIAKAVGKVFCLSILENVLKRVEATPPQSGLNKEQRQSNMQGVFALGKTSIKGKSILLVDDILTTGATMVEMTRVLKQAGASKVWCFSVAATPLL